MIFGHTRIKDWEFRKNKSSHEESVHSETTFKKFSPPKMTYPVATWGILQFLDKQFFTNFSKKSWFSELKPLRFYQCSTHFVTRKYRSVRIQKKQIFPWRIDWSCDNFFIFSLAKKWLVLQLLWTYCIFEHTILNNSLQKSSFSKLKPPRFGRCFSDFVTNKYQSLRIQKNQIFPWRNASPWDHF